MRVLIVEDNEMNRDMLGRRLVRAGHEVVFAEDGQAGERHRALAAGCDDFHTKPVDLPSLLATLTRLSGPKDAQ